MSISVLDALRTFRKPLLLVGVLVVGLFIGGWVNAAFFPRNAPAQPIEFSHEIHAGQNAVPCQYCHVHASQSISAGVPSVNKCVNCHNNLPGVRDKPGIVKLFDYWDAREPIPWVKVHDLPDFVYFPHKRHVQAGRACQECHGAVETMARVERVAPLKMLWCIDCHDQYEVANGRDCWTCHK